MYLAEKIWFPPIEETLAYDRCFIQDHSPRYLQTIDIVDERNDLPIAKFTPIPHRAPTSALYFHRITENPSTRFTL